MKKLINKNLYLRSLKELIYATVLVTSIALAILSMNHNGMDYTINIYYFSAMSYNPIIYSMFFIMIFGSFAISSVSLSFLRDKKNTDYVYSLPYTKGQIYVTKLTAAITMQLAMLVFILLFGIFMSFGLIGKITFLSDMMLVLFNAIIGSLVVMGAIFLSASITGKSLSTALLAAFLVILPALPYISKKYAISSIVDKLFDSSYSVSYSFYNITNFLNSIPEGAVLYRNLIPVLITFLIGAVYIILGYYLFKKRSGEVTGNHTKTKGLHLFVMGIIPSFTIYWLILTTSLGAGTLPNDFKNVVLFLLLALMFAVLYEVIVNRTLSKILRCFVVFICSIILVSSVHLGSAAITKYDMERSPEYWEVESINFIFDPSLFVNNYLYEKLSYGEHLVSSVDITDEEVIKYLLEKADLSYVNTGNGSRFQFIRLNLKSGKPIYKKIYIRAEYGDEQNYNEGDLDLIFENNPEFYEHINTAMPKENVTIIYGEYWLEALKNQEVMNSIYDSFINDYNEINIDDRENFRVYGQSFAVENQVNFLIDSKIPIGVLYVNGRVDNKDIIDVYKITRDTEESAYKYMQTANEINLPDFYEMYSDMKENANKTRQNLVLHVLYYDEENNGEVLFNLYKRISLTNVIPIEQEYYVEALTVLVSGENLTPKADDEFVKVVFYDDLGWEREVFLPISSEQIEELIKLNNEISR